MAAAGPTAGASRAPLHARAAYAGAGAPNQSCRTSAPLSASEDGLRGSQLPVEAAFPASSPEEDVGLAPSLTREAPAAKARRPATDPAAAAGVAAAAAAAAAAARRSAAPLGSGIGGAAFVGDGRCRCCWAGVATNEGASWEWG
jgi:hypothetical protein